MAQKTASGGPLRRPSGAPGPLRGAAPRLRLVLRAARAGRLFYALLPIELLGHATELALRVDRLSAFEPAVRGFESWCHRENKAPRFLYPY